MKLIFHHFLKDVCHSRWILGIWFVIVLLQNISDFLSVLPVNRMALETQSTSVFWIFLNGATWATLIIAIIQSEPVTGAVSFWRTRPVPPLIYAVSKLLFILVLLIVPVLVTKRIDLWLFEVRPKDVQETLLNLWWLQAYAAICVLWLATYTRSLLQFFGVVIVILLVLMATSTVYSKFTVILSGSDQRLDASRAILGGLIFFSGLILSLIIQYGLRKTRMAFVVGITSIFLMILISQWWPFVLPGATRANPNPGAEHLAYNLDATKPLIWSDRVQNEVTYQIANASLIIPASTTEGIPFIQSIETSFQSEGGPMIWLPVIAETRQINTGSLNWLPEVQKDNPGVAFSGPSPFGSSHSTFALSPDLAKRVKGQTGTLRLNLTGKFIRLQKVAEMPVQTTEFARIPDAFVRVASIERNQSQIDLYIKENGYVNTENWMSIPTVYVLVDSKKRIGQILSKLENSQATNPGGPLSRMSSQSRFYISGDLTASPLDDLVLYVYEETAGPAFQSAITLPDYTMHPGDNSVGGDFADIAISKIEIASRGGVTATFSISSFTSKPVSLTICDGKAYRGGGNIGGKEGNTVTNGIGFNLNPERIPPVVNVSDAPWFKRLLIHEGEKRRLNAGERWYFDDFQTGDGVRHYAYVEIPK